ncbi:MAG: sulfotransferase [Alphaproteobacteria bacterium]|nr:sulfotransferase [Alphaproteobacteria bacterium]
MSAAAFFVVSSGRSGTAMLQKALASTPHVEMHHEYMVHIVQPLAVRRYMGLIGADEAEAVLAQTHAAAVRYSTGPQWGDSSNKLSWLIPELAALLPQAKFIHLVRDGRKVAGSYFRKLTEECYDERSTAILAEHAADPARVAPPPPEKKYWWPLPRRDDPLAATFLKIGQFGRIAWHWSEINRVILEALAALPAQQSQFVRLEDLRASPAKLEELYDFLNLPYRKETFAMFARPHNVNRPVDELLEPRQRAQFEAIAGEMMKRLGYASRAEYVVKY